MESIIALRRTNQKHWQARLSCSNCMSPCSPAPRPRTPVNQPCPALPAGTEQELTCSSYDTEDQFSKQTSRSNLESLPCSSPSPRSGIKLDKETEVNSEYQLAERQENQSETDTQESKADKRGSHSEKFAPKAEKCSLKAEKKAEAKRCSKACSKEEEKAASKATTKAAKAEVIKEVEPVCCTRSNCDDKSTKSLNSDPDNNLSQQNIDSCFPPCFQEKVQEAIMGKEEKKKKKSKTPKPPKPAKPSKDPKLERKSSAKTKNTKPKPKEKDKKKKPEKMKRFEPRKMKNCPTFTQIGSSVNHNCCSCMDAIALYLKEFLRFSCSLTTGHPAQDTEFQERVCDMLNILRTMCRDCFYLARYVLRLLFVD